MNAGIRDEVALPDPAVQSLVHPLDLPEARSLYRKARLVAAFTGLPVAALVAAIVAYAVRHVIPPLVVFLALSVFGALAVRWSTVRAWDYIPRKRQDRERPPPRAALLGRRDDGRRGRGGRRREALETLLIQLRRARGAGLPASRVASGARSHTIPIWWTGFDGPSPDW
ncbi:hypothetical protein [Actinoplanes sp. NBRC 103695]|uniref:hypothetical protein n=1 Tax=Actinoplanes sp. NBRC 103695 TaxID=3032202 RepID=UPI00249FB09A|nr:hypothetical protein [Actinoplanes sp. NBRC 103695]GLY94420.1 hypothetical protein Acsp02_16760 [Actinoplanes sp. NBRC 103695]